MATHGGIFTLTGERITPYRSINSTAPERDPYVLISGTLRDRAYDHRTGKRPYRRKTVANPIKRDSSETAIGSTRSWTGITEWSMIPATPQQRKQFEQARILRKAVKK